MNLKELQPFYRPLSRSSNFDYKFTVFTPVFNRAKTVNRVFSSLESQTFTDFEFLIINDGSEDHSHEVIQELINKSNLNIRYINNAKNRHKMACLMQAVKLARGEFFITLDSDDECVENALEVFLKRYQSIPKEKLSKISGVTSLCKDQNHNLIGEKFKEQPLFSSSFKNRLNDLDLSEKWGFTKTDILRGISINPEIFSQGYIPEGVLWNLIAKHHYKILYTNDVLRIYYLDTENSTSNENQGKNALGMIIFSMSMLNWFHEEYFWKNPKMFLFRIYALLRAANFLKYKRQDYIKAIDSNMIKLIINICWPFKKMFVR
ncbi:MAG TPA: glycosyltransferase family 2 protein [Xanthomarina sp.]|nr:glycosyltransferase family 2 protein [Xanthomarina sp.]